MGLGPCTTLPGRLPPSQAPPRGQYFLLCSGTPTDIQGSHASTKLQVEMLYIRANRKHLGRPERCQDSPRSLLYGPTMPKGVSSWSFPKDSWILGPIDLLLTKTGPGMISGEASHWPLLAIFFSFV